MRYRKLINNELALLKIANYERIVFYALAADKSFLDEVYRSITMVEEGKCPSQNLVSADYEVFAPAFDRLYSNYTALQRQFSPSILKLQEVKRQVEVSREEMGSLLANAMISKGFVKKLIDKIRMRGGRLPLVVIRCRRRIKALKDKLIEDNRYLIVNIAQGLGEKENLEDVVNYGIQGLVKAINLFDPVRRLKFSTYAFYWIQVFVREAIFNETGNIKVPVYLQKKMRRADRYYVKFLEENGRAPTQEELVLVSGVRGSELKEIERVKKMRVDSLHKPIGEKATLEDVLADDNGDEGLVEFVHVGLSKISGVGASIIVDTYGLNGKPALNNKEICEKYNINEKKLYILRKEAIASLKKALS